MDRRYTLLTVRAVDDNAGRFIEGTATTGDIDRVGDVVVPTGARFELPLPLLFQHMHTEPIGSVIKAEVTKAGIRIRAKLTAGVARADEVLRLIRDGALSAVSIGFQALKSSPLPGGGLRFDEWEWHELSVVSVPANPGAKISVAKCIAYTRTNTVREAIPGHPGAVRLDAIPGHPGAIKLLRAPRGPVLLLGHPDYGRHQ